MSMDLEKKVYSTEREHFIAGTRIGITTAVKKASAAVKAHAPVLLDSGEVKPVTSADGPYTGIYGITADSADTGAEAVIYLTGEFFADALALESGVKASDIEVPLRSIGTFLK